MSEHSFCRRMFSETRKKLKIKYKDIDIIKWDKNNNSYEVHVPSIFTPDGHGNLGNSFSGCCKFDAGFNALIELREELKEKEKNNE